MKHIYLNLKRFDVPPEFGGVNRLAPAAKWAAYIVESIQDGLEEYQREEIEFVLNLPEAHILGALAARKEGSPLKIGCQSVHWQDVEKGGSFGAMSSLRPAAAMAAIGCESTIIGHFEERSEREGVLLEAGVKDDAAVCRIMNKEIKAAIHRGLSVLYCIGEKSEDRHRWQEALERQLAVGLDGVDTGRVVIGYEPVWSIGPGKKPASVEDISEAARFIKKKTKGMDVVYGGGLRPDNAAALAKVPEIDGGVIALTRFQGEIGFYPEDYLEFIRLYMRQ